MESVGPGGDALVDLVDWWSGIWTEEFSA
jgi:hypothetical protein